MKTQPTPEKHHCSKRVYSGLRHVFGDHRCTRPGTVQENGGWWCAMHVPSTVARHRQEKSEKWEAERKREARRDKLEAAAPKAIAALEDCIKWLSVGQRPQCKAETLEDLIRITAGALAELKGE